MWQDGGWGGWLAMALMMIAFWGGAIAPVVWLVKAEARSRPGAGKSGRALWTSWMSGSPEASSTRRSSRLGGPPWAEARSRVEVDSHTPLGYHEPGILVPGKVRACTATR